MELPTDVEGVRHCAELWLSRIRSVYHGSPALPDITDRQKELAMDVLVAFRAFASSSKWDRIKADDWDSFYAKLTDGLPVGEFVRAEQRFEQLQLWLHERYGVCVFVLHVQGLTDRRIFFFV